MHKPFFPASYKIKRYTMNTEALAELHEAYAACGKKNPAHPWTREETITLGKLYVAAHGLIPTCPRMKGHYSLPDKQVILRLWGSFSAYQNYLREATGCDT